MRIHRSLLAVACLVGAAPLAAQDPASGWRAEFIATLDGAADKYVRLAEAIPEEKYAWRPAEGVRSVAEVLLHVAAANYGLAGRLGATAPAGVNVQGLEKSTADKAEVLRHLRAAFAHFRAAVVAYPEANAEVTMNWFRPPRITARHFLYFNADHNGEHLGQLIAYARMNGVVPPWSGGD